MQPCALSSHAKKPAAIYAALIQGAFALGVMVCLQGYLLGARRNNEQGASD